MSYSSMRFVDKLHTDNPCLTTVWGLLTNYTQATIHVVLRYEVCWQVTHRLQSMVWGLLTSYTQITIHVLLWYEVCWQVTHRLQSMSYSGMRFVDKLHTDYNPCLTPVWGLLTSYTQTTTHVEKLHADYNPCLTPVWGLLTRLQLMS